MCCQRIGDFEDGMAKVIKNGKMGFINEQGDEVVPCIYDHLSDWENDRSKAMLNGEIFYIDRSGQKAEDSDLTNEAAKDSVIISYKNTYIDNEGNVTYLKNLLASQTKK